MITYCLSLVRHVVHMVNGNMAYLGYDHIIDILCVMLIELCLMSETNTATHTHIIVSDYETRLQYDIKLFRIEFNISYKSGLHYSKTPYIYIIVL